MGLTNELQPSVRSFSLSMTLLKAVRDEILRSDRAPNGYVDGCNK